MNLAFSFVKQTARKLLAKSVLIFYGKGIGCRRECSHLCLFVRLRCGTISYARWSQGLEATSVSRMLWERLALKGVRGKGLGCRRECSHLFVFVGLRCGATSQNEAKDTSAF